MVMASFNNMKEFEQWLLREVIKEFELQQLMH